MYSKIYITLSILWLWYSYPYFDCNTVIPTLIVIQLSFNYPPPCSFGLLGGRNSHQIQFYVSNKMINISALKNLPPSPTYSFLAGLNIHKTIYYVRQYNHFFTLYWWKEYTRTRTNRRSIAGQLFRKKLPCDCLWKIGGFFYFLLVLTFLQKPKLIKTSKVLQLTSISSLSDCVDLARYQLVLMKCRLKVLHPYSFRII